MALAVATGSTLSTGHQRSLVAINGFLLISSLNRSPDVRKVCYDLFKDGPWWAPDSDNDA